MNDKIIANFVMKEEETIKSSFLIKQEERLNAKLSITPSIKKHNDLSGRDDENCHQIGSISGLSEELNSKQNIISDLQEIRAGSEKGETAVQPEELADVIGRFATKEYVDEKTSSAGTSVIWRTL